MDHVSFQHKETARHEERHRVAGPACPVPGDTTCIIHTQAFGEQMLQTFRDHYRDAVETEGEAEAHFWVRVAGDAGKSVVREHLAALAERIGLMQTVLAAPFGVWRRRQTRRLALVTPLCLIAEVWTRRRDRATPRRGGRLSVSDRPD